MVMVMATSMTLQDWQTQIEKTTILQACFVMCHMLCHIASVLVMCHLLCHISASVLCDVPHVAHALCATCTLRLEFVVIVRMSKAPFVVVDWPVPVSVNLSAAATMYNVMASRCPLSQGEEASCLS
jgi:hypothetical protein